MVRYRPRSVAIFL